MKRIYQPTQRRFEMVLLLQRIQRGGVLVVNVPKLLVYSKTFRFVLGTFQKCCGTLRRFHMFRNFQFTPKHSDLFWGQFKIVLENVLEKFQGCSENIQICFWDISKVFQNIKTFSKVFQNILTCLVDCPVFIMFQNFQFIMKH